MTKVNPVIAIDDLKKEWQKKYGEGNCRELIADSKSVFVFDPRVDFNKMKIVVAARQKSIGHLVDAVLNNCWLGGDEELKKDERFKQGLEDQLDEMIDIPEALEEELANGNVKLTIGNATIEVRKATRMDLRYSEDRNPDNKPLMSQVYLLDRVAVNTEELEAIKNNTVAYMAALLKVRDLKDKKYVEVKKF